MAELDEILLGLPWLINYRAVLRRDDQGWLLDLEISTLETPEIKPKSLKATRHAVEAALAESGVLEHGLLRLGACTWGASINQLSGPVKRSLRIEPFVRES